MQLYYSQTSPFARKVTMMLKFTGLINDCELVLTTFENQELREKNPLGKIPALVDGDFCLFESDLICEFLDDKYALEGNNSLLNRGSRHYYAERLNAALANGILEAAVNIVFEKRRDTEQSEYWIDRWYQAISSSLAEVSIEHAGKAESPNLNTFSLATALAYLDLRHEAFDWRQKRPDLVEWFIEVQSCEWFSAC